MMNNSLKKYQALRSRREQRSLERWAQIRAEGQKWFVVKTSLTYGLTMVGVMDVYARIVDIAPRSISLRSVIYYVLIGIPIGFFLVVEHGMQIL